MCLVEAGASPSSLPKRRGKNVESAFQAKVIRKLRVMFPNCYILKNDPNYHQGVPDLTLLWGGYWATLECKDSSASPFQPNQRYHVDQMNDMSFSAFIYPENEEEVLDALQRAFGSNWPARVPQRE